MEATQVSIDEWMEKQNIVYPYTKVPWKKKEILSRAPRMDLEDIMPKETIQSQ